MAESESHLCNNDVECLDRCKELDTTIPLILPSHVNSVKLTKGKNWQRDLEQRT